MQSPTAHDMTISFYDESAAEGTIRRLPLCGEQNETKQGFSMFQWHSKTSRSTAATKRALSQIQYWVGGSICAMRLVMSDGSRSPKFGHFHPLDKWQVLANTDNVKYIEMRGDSEYV